jgi:multidrug resistance efflux pump
VAAEDLLKRIYLIAPQDGKIFQRSVHTVGGVIQAGEVVMLVVPDSDALIIEAKVPHTDVDQLHLGQRAVVRFSSFNRRTTPELNGEVIESAPTSRRTKSETRVTTRSGSASPTASSRAWTACSRWPACPSRPSSRRRREL